MNKCYNYLEGESTYMSQKTECNCCDSLVNSNEKLVLYEILFAIVVYVFAFFVHQISVKIVLFITAYIISGADVIIGAIRNVKRGLIFDENFLMFVATLGAILIGEYPEAVMVMLLYKIGEYFQDKAVDKSRASISALMNIKPEYAYVVSGETIKKVSPEKVNVGDIILINTGEKIPLDGIVIEGSADVDTSALTGESKLAGLTVGDKAISGCINISGVLKIRVEKQLSESTVSKILELVENAAEKKAKSEKYITKFARYYTPIVVIAAILIVLIPVLFMNKAFTPWFNRALIFLVISCPCAFVISVPLTFFAGIGCASKEGILIKGSNYIEKLSRPDTILFDKTGTLTKGTFKVSNIICNDGYNYNNILEYAAAAEWHSNHPIAVSIKNTFSGLIDEKNISSVEEFSGRGTKVVYSGDEIIVGSGKFLSEHGIMFEESSDFGTIIYVAKNRQYIGYILISDVIKEDAKDTITLLKNKKIKTVMLTGDVDNIGQAVGFKINIDEVKTQMLPADKVKILEYKILQNKDKKGFRKSVLFVGDGINDAPVLRQADVGIAMGGLGSDAAIEAADVVIMNDELSKIPKLIDISRKTMTIVNENIAFAIIVKFVFLLLGALGYMTLWGAVFADVGVTLLAVLNALRMLKFSR